MRAVQFSPFKLNKDDIFL